MRKLTFSILLVLFMVPLAGAKPAVDSDEVPFVFQNGLVIVDAKIKGKLPVQVVLATGIEYSLVDTALLDKYELVVNYSSDGPVIGRPTDSTFNFTKVSGVSVGGSKSKELSMRLGSLSKIDQTTGREIFAVLGADFFEKQIVQFDFKKSVVRFLAKSPTDGGKDKTDVSGATTHVVLRMAEKVDNPFKKTFVIPLVGDVNINGKQVKLLLDTGRATSLAFSSSAAKKVGLTIPAENDPPRADKADVDLAGYKLSDVPVMLFAKGSSADQSLSSFGVVAGSTFLREFTATFDFDKKIVLLERS